MTDINIDEQENVSKINGNGKVKEVQPVLKRTASTSLAATTGPQRVPLATTRNATNGGHVRASSIRVQRPHGPARVVHRVPVPVPQEYLEPSPEEDDVDMEDEEQPAPARPLSVEEVSLLVSQDEGDMAADAVEVESDDEDAEHALGPKPGRMWPEVSTERAQRYKREVDEIRETFEDTVDEFDMTMVSEYAEEIFEYMNELEVSGILLTLPWLILIASSGGRHAEP